MRELQTEPAISIWLEPSEHGVNFLNFIIENKGQGAALNVRLTATPDFQRFKDQYLSELGMFKHGIQHLAPGQRITFFLTSILEDIHGAGPDLSRLDFVVRAAYESTVGRKFDQAFPIHFESFAGFGTIGDPPLISIARDLAKLQKDIAHLASGFHKMQVVVNTRAEIAEDHRKVIERHEARRLAAESQDKPDS